MKLLHVISSLEIGGAQRLISDLLPIQKQQGLDVTLLVLRSEETDFTKKVRDAGAGHHHRCRYSYHIAERKEFPQSNDCTQNA